MKELLEEMLMRCRGTDKNLESSDLRHLVISAVDKIGLIAGIVCTLIFTTAAIARDHSVQERQGHRYGHVHTHRYHVRPYNARRGYVLPRGRGLLGCRHWSPIGVYWTCYFW